MRVCMKNVVKFLHVQQKLGKKGKQFRMLKLSAPLWKIKGGLP